MIYKFISEIKKALLSLFVLNMIDLSIRFPSHCKWWKERTVRNSKCKYCFIRYSDYFHVVFVLLREYYDNVTYCLILSTLKASIYDKYHVWYKKLWGHLHAWRLKQLGSSVLKLAQYLPSFLEISCPNKHSSF